MLNFSAGNLKWGQYYNYIYLTEKIYYNRDFSRQFFMKITFAFIKFFDFLVKIAIFGAFLFRSRDSRHVTARNQRSIAAVMRDANLSIEREMLQKWLF